MFTDTKQEMPIVGTVGDQVEGYIGSHARRQCQGNFNDCSKELFIIWEDEIHRVRTLKADRCTKHSAIRRSAVTLKPNIRCAIGSSSNTLTFNVHLYSDRLSHINIESQCKQIRGIVVSNISLSNEFLLTHQVHLVSTANGRSNVIVLSRKQCMGLYNETRQLMLGPKIGREQSLSYIMSKHPESFMPI